MQNAGLNEAQAGIKIAGIWSHHFMANRQGNNGNLETLFWGAPKSLQMVIVAMKFQISNRDLEKAEEPEIKLSTSVGSSKKQESSRKTSISALLIMPKPLTVWITINCGKFFKRWE